MFDSNILFWFCAASLGVLIIPGPAVFYVLARSVEHGPVAGIVSVLGISLGGLGHVMAAALGISALVLSSALAFSIIKYLGAAYLIYLGFRAFMSKDTVVTASAPRFASLSSMFFQGVVVNLLNPKTALFFLAFLPQFVDPSTASMGLQIVQLGLIFIVLGIISDGAYVLLAGGLGNWIKNSTRTRGWGKWFSGSVFIALGAFAALTEPTAE